MRILACCSVISLASFPLPRTRAYVTTGAGHARAGPAVGVGVPRRVGLAALTERQMQFWEDVEEGLDDMEAFYAKRGQSIDRIREFGKR
jgi:hypothetical protein